MFHRQFLFLYSKRMLWNYTQLIFTKFSVVSQSGDIRMTAKVVERPRVNRPTVQQLFLDVSDKMASIWKNVAEQ